MAEKAHFSGCKGHEKRCKGLRIFKNFKSCLHLKLWPLHQIALFILFCIKSKDVALAHIQVALAPISIYRICGPSAHYLSHCNDLLEYLNRFKYCVLLPINIIFRIKDNFFHVFNLHNVGFYWFGCFNAT